MATLTIRLDSDLRDDLERLAKDRGSSVSELIRLGVGHVLGRDNEREPRYQTPGTLPIVERRILSRLHEVLAELTQDSADAADHRMRAEALTAGYAAEYSDEFLDIEPELTPVDCALLWDILDMFRQLNHSLASLGDKPAELAKGALTFRGLDANNQFESHLTRYARFLIAAGRWDDMAEYFDAAHSFGNSHARMVPTYQRMLAVYQPIWEKKIHDRGSNFRLTLEELQTVAATRQHPAAG